MAASDQAIRLDKWLWHARFCKSRSLAAKLITEGVVRLNAARVQKPSAAIRIGDGLSFAIGKRIHTVRVTGLGTRRGPPAEAQSLYLDLDAAPIIPDGLDPGPEADK
jgi:ribosome-associated heat shock protein Hsp15